MNLDRRRIGEEIVVIVWDHALIQGRFKKKPFLCKVRGMVVDVDDQKIVLAYWTIMKADKETRDLNREECVLMKSCIESWGISQVLKWHPLC